MIRAMVKHFNEDFFKMIAIPARTSSQWFVFEAVSSVYTQPACRICRVDGLFKESHE
jgi:hypothetical protein